MRKFLMFFAGTLITGLLLAGGLVTNTNQSASWVRLPSRNASTEIDAVYYNPAGLMKLENGFHISLSNQSIFQTREITSSYSGPTVPGYTYGLNEHLYTGSVTALAFPSIYAVYKMEKLAFSFGFNPVGGGGGAEYEKGLPSFEMSPSDLVPALASRGATAYRLDAYFKGSSIFFGFQGGLSYKINDWISVAAGIRYVTAKNTYSGHLQDIELNMGGIWTKASDVFTGLAAQLTSITTIPTQVQPFTSNPATQNMNLTQLLAVGLPAASKTSIEAALTAIGVPAANIPVMTITQISGAITTATPTLLTQAATATATSTLVANQAADVTQTGSGIAPVFSVNISPSENINIAIKYELATKLELENETTTDLTVGYTATGTKITMFPNGAVTRNDMPAMLALGIDYRVIPALKISLGTNYYFDKSADYGHKVDDDLNSSTPTIHIDNSNIIENNGLTFGAGLEYTLSDKLLVSGGYVYGNLGVNEKYQSDLTFANSTNSIGLGGAYFINENIKINLGFGYTMYQQSEKTVDHLFAPLSANIPAQETYKKSTTMIGIGLDFRF